MRHVCEILRLSLEAGLSTRVVGERIGVGSTTVRDTLKRFTRAKLTWPVPPEISDTDLEQRLYGVPGVKPGRAAKLPEPDWSVVAREMKRKPVTLQILWAGSVGRLHRRAPGWVSLQPVLRPAPGLGGSAAVDDAAEPRRRREAVHRLRRRQGAGGRPPDRRGPRCADIRGGDGRLEPVVRSCDLDRADGRLGRWATGQMGDWIEGHNAAFAFFGGAPRPLPSKAL